MINENCIKDLINYIEQNLKLKKLGKPIPLKLKQIVYKEPLSNYSHEDVYCAAQYLIDAKLIKTSLPKSNPRNYKIIGITPQGYTFMKIVNDKSLWNRMKPVLKSTAPQLILNLISDLLFN